MHLLLDLYQRKSWNDNYYSWIHRNLLNELLSRLSSKIICVNLLLRNSLYSKRHHINDEIWTNTFSNFRNRHHMINLQSYTFRRQTLSSVLIIEPALVITFYLINYNPAWNYDAGVVLDNSDFNMLIGVIGFMGILSFLLSIKPNLTKIFKSTKKDDFPHDSHEIDAHE